MPSSRHHRRAAAGKRMFPLMENRHPLGITVKGYLLESAGRHRVRQKAATELLDCNGNLVGWVICDPPVKGAPSRPSSCVLSKAEMQLIAGAMFRDGQSRTLGMTEEQRRQREADGFPPEDAVEMALQKQRAFHSSANYATGDKAVRVYPKG